MPPGGDGFYYFSIYLLAEIGKRARFEIRINEIGLCIAFLEQEDSPNDEGQAACSVAYYASAGW